MKELLHTLLLFYSYLLDEKSFKILHSENYDSTQVSVTFSVRNLEFIFSREKGQILIEVKGGNDDPEWFDFYLLQKYFGEVGLDFMESNVRAEFLRNHLAEIEKLFSSDRILNTKRILTELRQY